MPASIGFIYLKEIINAFLILTSIKKYAIINSKIPNCSSLPFRGGAYGKVGEWREWGMRKIVGLLLFVLLCLPAGAEDPWGDIRDMDTYSFLVYKTKVVPSGGERHGNYYYIFGYPDFLEGINPEQVYLGPDDPIRQAYFKHSCIFMVFPKDGYWYYYRCNESWVG
jgi:hypothetical protein